MRKLAAVALILALPALVAADINRLKPSPDLDRPDALPWNMRTRRPELRVAYPAQPSWASISRPNPVRSKSVGPCHATAPQHVTRCLPQPDCRNDGNIPVLWPHAPRVDEQKTVAMEPRPDRGQIQ